MHPLVLGREYPHKITTREPDEPARTTCEQPVSAASTNLDKLDPMTPPARLPLRHGTFCARLAAASHPRA